MLTESARDPGQGGQRTQWSEVPLVSQHMGREELSVAVWGAGLQPEEAEVKPRVG